MKKIKQIVAVMTPFPYSIDGEESLAAAREMMARKKIKHLPVSENGQLAGIISERDIDQAEINVTNLGSEQLTVGQISQRHVYKAEVSTPMDTVLSQMAQRHIGSVLVTKDDRLVGIFTSTDACRCFAEHLRQGFPKQDQQPHLA